MNRIIISPFEFNHGNIFKNVQSKVETGLTILLYQNNIDVNGYGPYGLCIDNDGSNFLKLLFINSVWWNIEKKNYMELDNSSINEINLLYLPGIFFFNLIKTIKNELDEALIMEKENIKLTLTTKYHKFNLEPKANHILTIYDKDKNEYDFKKIEYLIDLKQEFCIWNNNANYGRNLIFFSTDSLLKKIKDVALKLSISIDEIDSLKDLKQW